jgi:hypothetical protein
MKALQQWSLCLWIFLLVSCQKGGVINSNFVDIIVLNQQGQNILAAPAVYEKSNIEVYKIINGQAQLVNEHKFLADKGFILLNKDTGKEAIRVILNYDGKKSTALTLIKFGNTKIDTIRAEFRFPGNSVILEKVWFNGVRKSGTFSIIK